MFTLFNVWRRRNELPTHGFFDEVSKDCRVGLSDIDLNLHLNNAKYLRYMDLARLEQLLTTGALRKLWARQANPIIANTEISYIRELRTFQKFTVSARVVGVDEKYMYFEQRFTSGGKLCTHAFLRMACVHQGKPRPIADILEWLGVDTPPPALPEAVLLWKDMLEAKKRLTLGAPAKTTEPKVEKSQHVA